jgi:hypothetical protein
VIKMGLRAGAVDETRALISQIHWSSENISKNVIDSAWPIMGGLW